MTAGAAALVVSLLLGPSPASAGETPAGIHRVRWGPGEARLGTEVARLLPDVAADVARGLGFAPVDRSIEVVVVADLESMRAEARAHVPAWAAGVAQASRLRVILRADRVYGAPQGVTPLLRHEWVHIAWGVEAGRWRTGLPLWAEEGLAESVGGAVPLDAGADLDFAASFGRLIPLDDLRERFPADAGSADLAYQQARSFIDFLARHRGWDELRTVLHEVARGQDADAVAGAAFASRLRAHSGRSLTEWEIAWRAAVEEEAETWAHLLLRDVPWALMAAAATACIGLFFVVRRRRRRALDAMGEDERRSFVAPFPVSDLGEEAGSTGEVGRGEGEREGGPRTDAGK